MEEEEQVPAAQRKYQTALQLHGYANVCKKTMYFRTFPSATREVRISLTLASSQQKSTTTSSEGRAFKVLIIKYRS